MKPESGNRIMLTHNRERGFVQCASWSTDGSRLYFDRWTGGPAGIYTVPALGGDEQLILENAMTPEVLPDGSLLLIKIDSEHRNALYHYWPDSGKLQSYPIEVPPQFASSRAIPGTPQVLTFGHSLVSGAEPGYHAQVLDLASGQMRGLPVDVSATTFTPLAVTRDGKHALISVLRGNVYEIVSQPMDGRAAPTTLLMFTHPTYSLD